MPDVLKSHSLPSNAQCLGAALLVACGASLVSAAPVRTEHTTASLVADHEVVQPGQTFEAALRLRHDAGWHSYWINPGDSGLATRIVWSLPEGWQAGPMRWPTPARFEVDGLANYGYAGEVWLPVSIEAPTDLTLGSTVVLSAEARWLACADICVAERARLELPLRIDVAAKPDARAEALQQRLDKLPRPLQVRSGAIGRVDGGFDFRLEGLDALRAGARYAVFPRTPQWLQHAPLETAVAADHSLHFAAGRSDFFVGWPDTPVLMLRPTLEDQPAFELRLMLDPPLPVGESR